MTQLDDLEIRLVPVGDWTFHCVIGNLIFARIIWDDEDKEWKVHQELKVGSTHYETPGYKWVKPAFEEVESRWGVLYNKLIGEYE